MAAYKQSQSICRTLCEAGEKGLSMKNIFTAEAASASAQGDIFSLDIVLTEALRLAVSDGRVVIGKDGRYSLTDNIRSAMTVSRLPGILSANEDSSICAICNSNILGPQLGLPDIAACCGKRACARCIESGACFAKADDGTTTLCSICLDDASDKERLRKLKRNCRKKYPWALCVFGSGRFQDGEYVTGSAYESVRALRKAATCHHPRAQIVLSQHLFSGAGCSVDVREALSCLQRCALVDPSYEATAQNLIFSFVTDELQKGDAELAVDICSQLAAAGNAKAQFFISAYGMFLNHGGQDLEFTYRWQVMACMNNSHMAKLGPAETALRLGKLPQARLFWRRYRQLGGSNFIESGLGTFDAGASIDLLRKTLRALKQNCAYCGISLERKSRKICKGCETVAFCSRDCQKMDWNRSGGHRNDCKDTKALREDLP
eukprot:CAMPEP_0181033816 /NCGR_PEP_ID=MMETSP1070-20121207/7456_1 /TAXON_ID=265543 /ORGANISM="Minutocellus polymorphus, Strain NH13" /LENGTH=432 /DNA_ID=CAMNT_0023111263 /DNA_START=471 /DNA_END=1769 /DNA_ORIENTATION=-